MKKLSVCVLFGGISPEHAVSLRSAESVLNPFFNDPLFLAGLAVVGFALLWGPLAALRWAKSCARRG